MESKDQKAKKNKPSYRWLRRLSRVMAGVVVVFVILILFIRSPWGQQIIADKLVNYISDKTDTRIEVDKFFITFGGDLQIEGLFLEDKKGDTLVYSNSLRADIPLWKTITGEAYGIENLEWNGLTANITRKDTINGYNFQFLLDAFNASNSDTTDSASENSEEVNLILGTFNFSDFDIKFYDDVIGIKSDYSIGQLRAEVQNVQLDSLAFALESLVIKNSNFNIRQSPTESKDDDSNSPLPEIKIQQISLEDVKTYFQNEDLSTGIQLGNAQLEELFLGMGDFKYTANLLAMDQAIISVNLMSTEETENKPQEAESSFEWPELVLAADEIDMKNSKFEYTVNDETPSRKVFNANAVALNNLRIKANNFYLRDKSVHLEAQSIAFEEMCGIQLDRLKGDFSVDEGAMTFKGLAIRLNNNQIDGDILLSYDSLDQFLKQPEIFQLDANIPNYDIRLNGLFAFLPDLQSNIYVSKLGQKALTGSLMAKGDQKILNLETFNLNWGTNTIVSTSGYLQDALSTDSLFLDLQRLSFKSTVGDVNTFYDTEQIGIQFPESIQLQGQIKGGIDDFFTDLTLETTQGNLKLAGNFQNQKQFSYEATIDILNYKLNKLLQNNSLGELTMNIEAKGNGYDAYSSDSRVMAEVKTFQYGGYTFSNFDITGQLLDGEGDLSTSYKDENLNMDLQTSVQLDSTRISTVSDLNLKGANLYALGLLDREIKTGFKLALDFTMKDAQYEADLKLNEGVVVYDNNNYLFGDLDSKLFVANDTTSIYVKNKMLDLDLRSNANPQQLSQSLKNHVLRYFQKDTIQQDTISNPVKMKLKGTIAQSPIMKEVFLVNLKDLDTVHLSMNFDEKKQNLDAMLNAPHINYYGNEIDSLRFNIHTTDKEFNFNLSFNGIQSGPLSLPQTHFSGVQTAESLSLLFKAVRENSTLMYLKSSITSDEDMIRYSIDPDSLIINEKFWKISENNQALYAGDSISFNAFKIERNDQFIRLTDKLSKIDKSHVALEFQNFNLKEIFAYFNPDDELAKGILQGDLILTRPFSKSGILANLHVDDLEVLNTDFGVLNIDGKSLLGDTYGLDISLKEGVLDMDINGQYVQKGSDDDLNFKVNINTFKMEALDNLSMGKLKNGKGYVSGLITVKGTSSTPVYNGQLNFKEAGFNVAMLNSAFLLPNEQLTFNNERITLKDFIIEDANGNRLVASGEIGTENSLNPTFDLSLKAENFKVLDAEKGDNTLFYGLAIFDADATIKGDLQIPKIKARLDIDPKTDFVYILPPSTASIENRDGVVTFVNRENPDAILTQSEKQIAEVTGFDIETTVNVAEEAKFKVVIDDNTENEFQVQGKGELNLRMFPNGRLNLSGIYEAKSGYYKLSLYDLVKRKFLIAPDSKIVWNGDPFNAELDVKAIYNVETSASSLMATQTSSLDPSERTQYNQVLPFNVFLNIEGELYQPEISFRLDLDEEERDAAGGRIYGRVQQLNQREEELNQQVFSLLVLNRFYPQPGSDGSAGGFSSLAQQNVNDAIADRLNAFSDQILGKSSVELNFGLDSYTDYQGNSATQRTQLNVAAQKKFLDDRLTVRVGSDINVQGSDTNGETTPVVGNVSIIYELTPDGRYRLKGFRRNTFENVIDGQTIVDGIALIFTQDFNRFDQLWNALFNREEYNPIEIIDDKNKDKPTPKKENTTTNKND